MRYNFKREQNRSFESFVHLSNICRKKRKKNVTSWHGQFTSKIRLGISDKIFILSDVRFILAFTNHISNVEVELEYRTSSFWVDHINTTVTHQVPNICGFQLSLTKGILQRLLGTNYYLGKQRFSLSCENSNSWLLNHEYPIATT